jgi:hypothetical protein
MAATTSERVVTGSIGIGIEKSRYCGVKEVVKAWVANQILFVITIMILLGMIGGLKLAEYLYDKEVNKIVVTKVLLYKDAKGLDVVYELKQRM